MPAPELIKYKDWMDRTDVSKWHGQSLKKRSAELLQVDQLLDAYTKSKTPSNLEFLADALDVWIAKKTKDGKMVTCRDHDDAVAELKAKVDAAFVLQDPQATKYPGIFIGVDIYRGTAWVPDDFATAVENGLKSIASKPIGKKLLKDISAACVSNKKVIIEYSGAGSSAAPIENLTNDERKKIQKTSPGSPTLNVQELLANKKLVAKSTGNTPDGKRKIFTNGKGISAIVTWNQTDSGLDGRPSFIGLAHELVHAYHYVLGCCYRAPTGMIQDKGDSGIMEEEMRTVGILKYDGEIPSENAIRGEHNLAVRKAYSPGQSFDKVTATALN